MRTKAAVIRDYDTALEVVELDLEEPRAGEVLVRICASGLCHSDLSTIEGKMPTRLPAVLGHEGAGVVEKVGAGVDEVAVGDHVVLSWLPICHECANCLRGYPQLCEAAWPPMFEGGLMDGSTRLSLDGEPVYHYSMSSTFAEFMVVPSRSVVPIPKDVPFDVASLVGCAVTTGTGAVWRTAEVEPGASVAIFGCGGVGLSALIGAAAISASEIIAVDTVEQKLEFAQELGASDTVLWRDGPGETGEVVRRCSSTGAGVDYAFEATGVPDVMTAAFLSLRPRGTAVLIGIPAADDKLVVPAQPIPRGERRIIGSIYGSADPRRDFPMLVELYRTGRLPLARLITQRIGLDEINDGFEAIRRGQTVRSVLMMA